MIRSLRISLTCPARVIVSPAWIETCQVTAEAANGESTAVLQDGDKVSECPESAPPVVVTAQVPRMLDALEIRCPGPIHVTDKIESSLLDLQSTSDNVDIVKLRGEDVNVTASGSLSISSLLEGTTMFVKAGNSIQAKRVQAHDVRMLAGSDVTVQAMYARSAVTSAPLGVSVSHFHGVLQADTNQGNLTVGSVDGAVEAKSHEGDISLHINTISNNAATLAQTGSGNVEISVSEDVEAWVQLETESGQVSGPDGLTGGAGSLDDRERYLEGMVKRVVRKSRKTSGKISTDAAFEANKTAFFSPSADGTHCASLFGSSRSGNVNLRVLSWADNIRERFLGRSKTNPAARTANT